MRTHEEYQEALNKIVENSCPKGTNCQSCEISNRCNCLMKNEVDKIQELIDKLKPRKIYELANDNGEPIAPRGVVACEVCDGYVDKGDKICKHCGQVLRSDE